MIFSFYVIWVSKVSYCYLFFSRRSSYVIRKLLNICSFFFWNHGTNLNEIEYIAYIGKGKITLWKPWPLPSWGLRGGSKITKINAIFKNILHSWTSSSQTTGMIVEIIELSTKIEKLMAPGPGVLVSGWGSNDYVMKIQ